MPPRLPPSNEMGFYFALAQTGVEMVVPIGIGVALDNYLGWSPWSVACGAVFGFAGGLTHLLLMLKRHEDGDSTRPPRDSQ